MILMFLAQHKMLDFDLNTNHSHKQNYWYLLSNSKQHLVTDWYHKLGIASFSLAMLMYDFVLHQKGAHILIGMYNVLRTFAISLTGVGHTDNLCSQQCKCIDFFLRLNSTPILSFWLRQYYTVQHQSTQSISWTDALVK